MNMKDNLIFIISFFPIFLIKSNFGFLEKTSILILYVLLIVFNSLLITFLKKKKKLQKSLS